MNTVKHQVQISNPPSGFTITFDKEVTEYLGGVYTPIAVKPKLSGDEISMRVFKKEGSRHRIVLRSSANRYSSSRFVDRFADLTRVFPVEFGPTLVPCKMQGGELLFTVPSLSKLRKPISRLRKETKIPFFNNSVKEKSNTFLLIKEIIDKDEKLKNEIIDYLGLQD